MAGLSYPDPECDPCQLLNVLSDAVESDPKWWAWIGLQMLRMAKDPGSIQVVLGLDFAGEWPLRHLWRRDAIDEALRLTELADRATSLLRHRAAGTVWQVMVDNLALNHNIHALHTHHWRHPLADTLDLYSRTLSIEPDPQSDAVNWAAVPFLRLLGGTSRERVAADADTHLTGAAQQNLLTYAESSRRLGGLVRALAGADVSFETLMTPPEPTDTVDTRLSHHYLAHLAALLLDRPALGPPESWPGYDMGHGRPDVLPFVLPEAAFVTALSLARALPGLVGSRRSAAEAELQFIREAFRTWAGVQADNYTAPHLLVEAEVARLSGDTLRAITCYEQAVGAAGRRGVVLYQALACECAARFHLAEGRPRLARPYLDEARYLHARWGALKAVERMDRTYGDLLGRADRSSPETVETRPSHGSPTSPGTGGAARLDLAAVVATAAAISSEMDLPRLLTALLGGVMAAAGATRGALLLEQGGRFFVEAEAEADGPAPVLQHQPMDVADLVAALVRRVIRTKAVVLVADAAADNRYAREARRRGVRAILAAPVVKQGRVVAVVYLENNLQAAVFTPDRVELLQLLSGQMAISIDNARLYADLDQKVRERAAELQEALTTLQRAQTQLVENEKMASLGQLTAGVAHELNNAVNFIAGSADPLRRDVEDLLALLGDYEKVFAQRPQDPLFAEAAVRRDEIDVETVREELAALLRGIDEGAHLTADIVQDLRTFSRLDEDKMVLADVRIGIDATLTLLRKTYEGRITVNREYNDLPLIECLAGRLNQVFMNLLANAVQAIPGEGSIAITGRTDGDWVDIAMADTGDGMSDDVRRRIFEPFYTTKPVGVGTGLGLSITYGIVERHHGTITVESAPGQGSTFTVRLPTHEPRSRSAD